MDLQTYNFYFNKLKSAKYPPQDHWNIFDEKYYEKISDYQQMASFRSNGISNMLETGLPSQDRFSLIEGNKSYEIDYNPHEIEELKKRFNELQIMMGEDLNTIELNSTVGNPRRFIHYTDKQKHLLNFDDLYHAYAAWQIKRYINLLFNDRKINKIVEIGAGYGNLAHKLKLAFRNVKYIIIDLPEVLLLQHYYLAQNNPSYKIINLLEGQGDLNVDESDFDFLLVPFSIYQELKLNFDALINNRSFGEMPCEVLTNYIKWTEENLNANGILYTVNRYVFTKSKDKNKIRNYPFDDLWKLIVSQPQWLQTHLHEFLLQRVPDKPIPSLRFLLQSFPISTPPPGPIMEKIQTQPEWIKNQNVN